MSFRTKDPILFLMTTARQPSVHQASSRCFCRVGSIASSSLPSSLSPLLLVTVAQQVLLFRYKKTKRYLLPS
jgi:hypothetical protein